MKINRGRLPNPYVKVFFIAIYILSKVGSWFLVCNLILTEIEGILKIIRGRLPNPNFKVFFIAISIIMQAMKLIFGMYLNVDLTR